jgi:hypothetical protein
MASIDGINVVSPDGKHQFPGVTRNEDSSYTSRCKCGFEFTGPNREAEPDIEQRKDAAWSAIAKHFVDEVITHATKTIREAME